ARRSRRASVRRRSRERTRPPVAPPRRETAGLRRASTRVGATTVTGARAPPRRRRCRPRQTAWRPSTRRGLRCSRTRGRAPRRWPEARRAGPAPSRCDRPRQTGCAWDPSWRQEFSRCLAVALNIDLSERLARPEQQDVEGPDADLHLSRRDVPRQPLDETQLEHPAISRVDLFETMADALAQKLGDLAVRGRRFAVGPPRVGQEILEVERPGPDPAGLAQVVEREVLGDPDEPGQHALALPPK